jgi:hypothetical protein
VSLGVQILLKDLGADRITGFIADRNVRRGERDGNCP